MLTRRILLRSIRLGPRTRKSLLFRAPKPLVLAPRSYHNFNPAKQTPATITFSNSQPNFLSNFFPDSPIVIDNKEWPSVEHYFQAQKFMDLEHRERVREAKSPREAQRLGKNAFRRDWPYCRKSVMEFAVRQKFEQHPHLRQQLIQTGDANLVFLSGNSFLHFFFSLLFLL